MPDLSTCERRERLLAWMRERPEHNGLTAAEIAAVSGIYIPDSVTYSPSERAGRDLRALEHAGSVLREGRPARWRACE